MRSSLPFCESMFGWFHLVMRDTVKVETVCLRALVFVCERVPTVCMCVYMQKKNWSKCVLCAVHTVCVYFVRVCLRDLLCVFVCVCSPTVSPWALMSCLWDTDLKLSDRSLSACDVSWAVHPDLSSRGGWAQYGCCLKTSHLCVVVFYKRRN